MSKHGTRISSRPLVLLYVFYAVFVALIAGGISYADKQQAPRTGEITASYVGNEACTDCHTIAGENWAHTVHAAVFTGTEGCETCHGPGSRHIEAPDDYSTIISFTWKSFQTPPEQNAQCLTCHSSGNHMHWIGSTHEASDIACSDCHNPMANISYSGLLARSTINETCMSCHKEQRTDFNRRSHMPLFEGKVGCLDCHDPHGTPFEALLSTPTVNETCYQCHAEKRGPFLFEHAPVAENCLNCHSPHGSNHEKLLVTARPLLCQQCHSAQGHMNDLITAGLLATGTRPDARLMGRSCQNCHSQIHGSNHPSGAKLHR